MKDIERRIKKRGEEEKRELTNRLKRIEGQVRGLIKMVEGDTYCNDILIQTSAVQSAISAFSKELLYEHMRSCVVNDIREGKSETVEELIHTVGRLIR